MSPLNILWLSYLYLNLEFLFIVRSKKIQRMQLFWGGGEWDRMAGQFFLHLLLNNLCLSNALKGYLGHLLNSLMIYF